MGMAEFAAERREAMCWHGVKLYECTDAEHTTPRATAGRGRDVAEVVTYYHGSGEFYVPITDRDDDMFGGSSIHPVGPCSHRHLTPGKAEVCGRAMTARAVAAWNAEHVPAEPAAPDADPAFPIVPAGQIDAEVAADWHRLTHPAPAGPVCGNRWPSAEQVWAAADAALADDETPGGAA